MGRYHYPLPETAAVQSVGLPWLGSGRRYKWLIEEGARSGGGLTQSEATGWP